MKHKQALSQEEADRRFQKAGIKALDMYVSGATYGRFICPICEKIFNTKPVDIFRGHVVSCGCGNLARRTGSKYIGGRHFTIIKKLAKRTNRDFNLDIEYLEKLLIKQDFKCALSQIPIQAGYNPDKITASLDRIDSTKGYIKGNVQWLHSHVNFMKQDYDQDYFIELCKLIAQNKGKL